MCELIFFSVTTTLAAFAERGGGGLFSDAVSCWDYIVTLVGELNASIKRGWNDTIENLSTRRKLCPSATLSSPNRTWIGLGLNSGPLGECQQLIASTKICKWRHINISRGGVVEILAKTKPWWPCRRKWQIFLQDGWGRCADGCFGTAWQANSQLLRIVVSLEIGRTSA